MRALPLCALPFLLIACGGGSAPPAKAPADDDKPEKAQPKAKDEKRKSEAPEAEASGMPTKCAGSGEACTPPIKFVKRLCADAFPGVALYMFRKGSPWTRGYLTRKTQAVNASGGKSGEGFLEFDEEVLVMLKRVGDYGGMQVSGAMGGWDVLRWDGTCATLASEELTLNVSPSPKAAKVDFRFLDDNIKEALRKDSKLDEVYLARRKECKGASSGEVTKKCEVLDKKFSETMVQVVRSGIELPVPDRLP
jgi:hypothetical protein